MSTTATRERPINLPAWEIRAALAGTKTQHRVPMKPQPESWCREVFFDDECESWAESSFTGKEAMEDDFAAIRKPPPFNVYDLLWVRETWTLASRDGYEQYKGLGCARTWPASMDRPHIQSRWNRVHNIVYRADGEYVASDGEHERWSPPLSMERWMSRLAIEVTCIRPERAHQISDSDVVAEGIEPQHIEKSRPFFHRDDIHALAFAEFWEKSHGKRFPWSSNPWVWVVSFRRVEGGSPC